MPFKAVLKVVNVFLGLGAFLAVGIMSLTAGEELIWAAGKAFVAFVICWMVLGWLLNLLAMSIVEADEAPEQKVPEEKTAEDTAG